MGKAAGSTRVGVNSSAAQGSASVWAVAGGWVLRPNQVEFVEEGTAENDTVSNYEVQCTGL